MRNVGPIWGLVPVKGFRRGKSRLQGVLESPARQRFARALFEHVTGTLAATPEIDRVLVLTDDDEVASAGRAHAHEIWRDGPRTRLSDVIDAGLQQAQRRGARGALVCMADLPRLEVAEVQLVLRGLSGADVVLVPDQEGRGTNVLGVCPPTRLTTCFGQPGSFERHLLGARQLGLQVRTVRTPGICFDVDGPEDLRRMG